MVIINQGVFNAFVADGRRIFVNYGAIMQSETPNQIIGVMAHETGHLAGGHLAKMREQMAQAQTQMIIAMLSAPARWSRARKAAAATVAWRMPARPCSRLPEKSSAATCCRTCASRRRTPTRPA